jgi:hypothetical protein
VPWLRTRLHSPSSQICICGVALMHTNIILVCKRKHIYRNRFRKFLQNVKVKLSSYSSYSLLTSELDGVSGQRHVQAALYPQERPAGNCMLLLVLSHSEATMVVSVLLIPNFGHPRLIGTCSCQSEGKISNHPTLQIHSWGRIERRWDGISFGPCEGP